MKKFCDKFTKQQWRVTVPNIGTTIFKKSPSKSRDDLCENQLTSKKCYGSYDLQAAVLEFEKTKSVVGSVVFDSASNISDSDSYQDAVDNAEKLGSVDDLDSSLYADVGTSIKSDTSRCPSACNEKFQNDVPKISFSFFDEPDNHEYQVKRTIDNASPEDFKATDVTDSAVSDEKTYTNVEVKSHRPRYVSKAKIMLAMSAPISDETDSQKLSKSENDISKSIPTMALTKRESLKITSTLMKSNSDPNLSSSQLNLDDMDDGLYKVPGPARRFGYSHSLVDLNKNIEFISSAHSSIEHISCSQVIAARALEEERAEKEDKIFQIKRKIALLKTPKSKTLINIRTKLNNMMIEQAATQRVGYFAEKEPAGVKIEEMYKLSKDKCKKILKSTGKFFNNKPKKDHENLISNGAIIKSDHAALAPQVPKRLNVGDIEYKINKYDSRGSENINDSLKSDKSESRTVTLGKKLLFRDNDDSRHSETDSQSPRYSFKKIKGAPEVPSGFEDLRKYVKQGGDFCKELSTILQERSDAEIQYAKHLQKLSVKLARACREGVGGLSDAWCSVANELECQAEAHRILGNALLEDSVRPLKNLNDNQHKIRKQAEIAVDKASKVLGDWRNAEAKSKKNSHACARDNEKLQDALLDVRLSKSAGLIQLAHTQSQKTVSDKENTKMEGKRKKAEDAVKKSDADYYNLCVRTERARLDWESAVLRGSTTFQILEEERLSNLKSTLNSYLHHVRELGPKLIESTDRLALPVAQSDPNKDLVAFMSLRNSSQQVAEQLLPDFYCEHITLAMNKERRKQGLIKLLQLIRQDIDRERKSKVGLENLSRAMKETPSFGAEESQQNVLEKLYHMKSMLTYLEGARYKVHNALAELENRPNKSGHPLAAHIIVTRDKSGLQQSILKVPQWLRDEWTEPERSPMSEKSTKSQNMSEIIDSDWMDRGAADGNSNQPDSDFDEFSSQGSSSGGMCTMEENPLHPIAFCKSLYDYTPNLPDELTLHAGDVISVYRKQDDGWWIGECNGSVGIFPATYVEVLGN